MLILKLLESADLRNLNQNERNLLDGVGVGGEVAELVARFGQKILDGEKWRVLALRRCRAA